MNRFIKSIFWVTFLLFTISLALFASAQNGNYEEGKVYRHKLENGLTILTVEKHDVPFIFHQLTYNVGSVNEPAGLTGISHVVEHMMFKGTKKYGKGVVSKIVSQNSGVFNAFTTWDMTSYYMYLPKNKIELAFDIESDRMQNSIFDSAEFKPEIEVILQERRMRMESNPSGIFHENLYATAFLTHPYRNPVIGWEGDLRRIKREDAYKYYKQFYTPNNAILVLVGDFETEEILKLAKKYYGKIPPGPELPKFEFYEPQQKAKRTFTVIHGDVTQPTITMVFHAPGYTHPDAPALYLASKILCERSRGSRLYKRLVEEEKLALGVGGGFPVSKYPKLFSISVTVNPDSSIDRVEKIVWEEINKMKSEPVTDYELKRAKNRYKFTEATEYVKNSDIAMRLSLWESYYGWDYYKTFYNSVLNVTAEDIMRVMNKYFNENAVTVGYLLPKEKKKVEETEEEILPIEEMKFNDDYPEFEKFFYTAKIKDANLSYTPQDTFDIIRPKPIAPLVKKSKLKNGIEVYTIQNKLVPTIVIAGIIETGFIREEIEGKAGISAILADVLNRGPANMNYVQYIDTLTFYPISISVRGGYRGFSFQGYSLVDNADRMCEILYNVITNPRMDTSDINLIKSKHLAVAKRRFVGTKVKAFYYMFDRIFKDHEYSKNKVTEETVSKISPDDVINHYKKYFRPERTTLIVVGNMSHSDMVKLVRKYFEKWKNTTPPPPIMHVSTASPLDEKEIKVFTDNEYTECTINIGFSPFNNIPQKDEEVADILNYILAQSALTSRIGVELRDKQGLIYGIRSELWNTRDGIGYWKINTKTAPGNVEKVINGIFKEIKKLLDEGITDEELVNAKRRMLGLLPLYAETPEDIASIVAQSIINKQKFEDFDRKYDRIMKITKDDVMKVAKKYLTLDRFIVVVDGPITAENIRNLMNSYKQN